MEQLWNKMSKKVEVVDGVKTVVEVILAIAAVLPAIYLYFEKAKTLLLTGKTGLACLFILFALSILFVSRHYIVTRFINLNTIKKFYKYVNLGQYERSWSLISDDFKKNRWQEDYLRFEKGFVFTQGVELLMCKHYRTVGSTSRYVAIYIDAVNCPQLSKLTGVRDLKIRDVKSLEKMTKEISKDLSTAKFDPETFLDMEILELLHHNFGDILRWKYKVDTLGNLESYHFVKKKYFSVKLVTITNHPIFWIFGKRKISGIRNLSAYESEDIAH